MEKNMWTEWKRYLTGLLIRKPLFLWMIAGTAFLSYGSLLFTRTINNDSIFFVYSDPLALIRQNRWGHTFLSLIGLIDRDVPLWGDMLGILLLILGGLLYTFLWHKISEGKIPQIAQVVFIMLYISFPLTLEMTIYPTFLLEFGICYSGIALTVIWIWHNTVFDWKKCLGEALLLAFCIACYESFCFVYLVTWFLILFFLIYTHRDWKEYRWRMLQAVAVLLLAVALRGLLILLFSVLFAQPLIAEESTGAAKKIYWLTGDFLNLVRSLRDSLLQEYFHKSVCYFSILVLNLAMAAMLLLAVCRKGVRGKLLLTCIGIFGALFGLSFLQGTCQPYRICQAFPIFTAFAGMMLLTFVKYRKTVGFFLLCIVLFQTKELCLLQAYDIEVSDRVKHDILMLERDLRRIPDIQHKTIIVCGNPEEKYDIRHSLTLPILYSYAEKRLNGNPVSQHCGMRYFCSSDVVQFRMLFEYYTKLRLTALPETERKELDHRLAQSGCPAYPERGYILRQGDQVIVNLGVRPSLPLRKVVQSVQH